MTAFSRRDLYVSAVVALFSTLWLLALASTYRIDSFYVSGQTLMSNDQVGYLTSARWLVDTGELRSHLIFPAHVREPMWRLYMPGHYYALAAGHVVFGDGPVAWRLPAMLCFAISAVGVFLVGRRWYDRPSGVVAALLFITFPMMTAFAFTAMPQLPFTAACVVAFCIFAFLPERARVFSIPILLMGPFLFRETGAFLVLPMALTIITTGGRRRWIGALAAVLCSVVVLYALLVWQIDSGKSALPLDGSRFNYDNAFPASSAPETTAQSLLENVSRNIQALRRHASRVDAIFVTLASMSALALIALVRGLRVRDGVALGAGMLFAAMFVVMTIFYTWALYRGVRAALFTFPFLAVSVAPTIVSLLGSQRRRWAFVTALAIAIGIWGNLRLARQIRPEAGIRAVERLEALDLDDSSVLIGPTDLSLDYVLRHYPIRWAFIPRNDETLELVAEKHRVGTIILRESELEAERRISESAIKDIGLARTRSFEHSNDQTYVVFERPRQSSSDVAFRVR